MSIVWQDPPPRRPDTCDSVMAQLLAEPGRWAKIDTGPVVMFPWWGRIYSDRERFEVRFVRHPGQGLFGTRDVYARAKPVAQS